MNQTASLQGVEPKTEAKEPIKQQLAQYLEQLPESKQTFHKLMKGLEFAVMLLIPVAFIVALYVSIAWKSYNPLLIPITWFIFAASISPALFLSGTHSIVLGAFPITSVIGKNLKFVTGSRDVWSGVAFIVLSLPC